MMKRFIIRYIYIALLLTPLIALGSTAKIEKQKSIIAALEKRVAEGEREITALRKSRAANEQKAQSLARQIETRNRLLTEQRRQEAILRADIASKGLRLEELSESVAEEQRKYGQMVREAYRSYSNHNMMTYLFSAKDFQDVARRVSNMRAVAELRERRIARIDSLQREVTHERNTLKERKSEQERVTQNLTQQKSKLQRDVTSAKANISAMSAKERKALQQKALQTQQLTAAVKELQKLIKGNKEGASFSGKTTSLNLPVIGGRVKQYRGNMAEITGAKDAKIISIYEGKVVDVRHNRITGKYDIYIAHGEYITSYAGLYSVSVAKDQSVKRGGVIGVIGEAVDIITMQSEYKLVFGIYPPTTKENISAAHCFKK